MKYLCLAYYDEKKFAALPAPELDALVTQCGLHDDALRASGRVFAQASLTSPQTTRSLRPRGGRISATDGPFVPSGEQIGGFFLIEASDLEEAVRIASKHPAANLGERVGWGIEIRAIENYEGAG